MQRELLFAFLAASPSAAADVELSIYAILEPQDVESSAGEPVTVEYTVTNSGSSEAEDVQVNFYLSADDTWGAGDTFLEGEDVSLDEFDTEDESEQVSVPSSTAPGCYSLLVVLDPFDQFPGDDDSNNTEAIDIAIDTSSATCGQAPPDLAVGALQVQPGLAQPGSSLDVVTSISNAGGELGAGAIGYAVVLSDDPVFDGVSQETLLQAGDLNLPQGGTPGTVLEEVALATSTAPGSYTILFVADPSDAIPEASESNNVAGAALEVLGSTQPIEFTGVVVGDAAQGWSIDCTNVQMASSALDLSALAGRELRYSGQWSGDPAAPLVAVDQASPAAIVLSAAAPALLGQSAEFTLLTPPSQPAWLFASGAPSFAPWPGGVDVAFISLDELIQVQSTLAPISGVSSFAIPVPADSALLGLEYFAQGASSTGSGDVVLSNPLCGTVQDQD